MMPTPTDHNPRPANLARKIALSRATLAFERIWASLHWPLVIAMAFAATVAGGVLPLLPRWPRLAVLVVFVLALLWSLKALARVSWPTRQEAMRRVEEKSGLSHRPVSAHQDRLAPAFEDPLQQAIWEEHRARQLRSLKDLRVGLPRSSWRDIDPRALRVPAALALAAALLLGPGDPRGNLTDSFAFAKPAAEIPLVIDAWLKPPAYTGKPPILLTSPAMVDKLKAEPEITVPEKATLTLRVTGAKSPILTFHELAEGDAVPPDVKGFEPKQKNAEGVYQADTVMTRPAMAILTDGGRELARWRIALLPDSPPSIEITGDPEGDSSGTLSVKWKATDDYGVSGITADIYLADEQDDGTGFTGTGIFEFDAPKFPVSLRKAMPKEEAGQSKADVAEHPWAGFMVEMTLTAKDAAGHETESVKKTFRLPERLFTKPLAKALIEQRKHLILAPEEAGSVVQMIDAMLTYPDGLIETSGIHLSLASTLSRLRAAENKDGIDEVIAMLWQIAVNVEDGTAANPKAELEAIRKELERALKEGASPERIAELTQKMREALDRYMQSLMDETAKQLNKQGQNQQQQQNQQQGGKSVTPQDLQKMLDMIDKLAQSGANEAAQEMLSQLEDILRNLKPGMPQQGEAQDSPLGQMLDKLSDLMRQQQKLMDETQRMPQDGMPQDPSQQPQGQPGQGNPGDLGDRQQGLSQMLQELMDQFGKNGMQAPKSFGDAGKSMKGAEGSLREGDREGALGNQGEAMAKLREGAQGLAKQLMQQGQGQQGNQGRNGQARGDDRDPLGRPMPNRGEDYGPNRNMLPSELAMQRAREILDMLRSRAGDVQLPKIERDYIERLLRGLY